MRKYIIISLPVLLLACSPKPKPIMYGHEACHFCSMTIVDQRFGCELVTNKGKVYLFDAIECMVNFIHENPEISRQEELILTNTFDRPGALLSIKECVFLHSQNLPSPMGMFINPVAEEDFAQDLKKKHSGEIYDWEGISSLVRDHHHGLSQK